MTNTKTKPANSLSQDLILVDVQKWAIKLLSYWWLFLISLGIAYAAGKLYLRYATNEYSARAILLIKDAGTSGVISEQNILLAEQGSLGGAKAMDNVIQILKSLTIMEKVVERLGIDVSYYRLGNIKESELYNNSPFLLESYTFKKPNEFGRSFFIEMQDYESFTLKFSEDAETGERYYFGVPFENQYGRFLIKHNSAVAIIPGSYRLAISPLEFVAMRYSFKLIVSRIGHQTASSVLELKMVDPVPEKIRDILNTLIETYNEEEILDENTVLRNTLEFIDNRVANLLIELDSIEGGVQAFKSANEIITENASSSLSFTLNEIRAGLQELSDFEIQKDLLKSLETFLVNENQAFELIPANLIAENPVLSGLVNQYNELVLNRNTMIATASQINPSRIALEQQMVNIRSLLLETIQNLQKDLEIPIQRLEAKVDGLKRNMSNIPGVEKRLIEKMRTQSIKENLFLYLLQKREETALSEAITTAKTRTIDRARTSKGPIYPRKKMILISSLLLGFLVPFFGIILRSFFESTITSEETIKSLTSMPLLGRIANSRDKTNIVVKQGSRSAINEMFRLLRANLNFLNPEKKQQTILFTSSISGEGKTFMVMNLGITIALSQKKVVLLGMDLRKPRLGTHLGGESSDLGISNYLINQCELQEVIKAYESNPNLFYIPAGTIPPNPTELLLSDRMNQLFSDLSEQFDYILIDTPPVSLVSDALLLRKFSDNILIIARHNYTRKNMLKELEEMYQSGELDGASLIYNGIKYGARYGRIGKYYYGYQQGYYTNDTE